MQMNRAPGKLVLSDINKIVKSIDLEFGSVNFTLDTLTYDVWHRIR